MQKKIVKEARNKWRKKIDAYTINDGYFFF